MAKEQLMKLESDLMCAAKNSHMKLRHKGHQYVASVQGEIFLKFASNKLKLYEKANLPFTRAGGSKA